MCSQNSYPNTLLTTLVSLPIGICVIPLIGSRHHEQSPRVMKKSRFALFGAGQREVADPAVAIANMLGQLNLG